MILLKKKRTQKFLLANKNNKHITYGFFYGDMKSSM